MTDFKAPYALIAIWAIDEKSIRIVLPDRCIPWAVRSILRAINYFSSAR
jgi:hypothetical protein